MQAASRQTTFGTVTHPWIAGEFDLIQTFHPPHTSLRAHDHEPATLVIVTGGEFVEVIGGKTFECIPGTVLLKPPGAHHANQYGARGSTALLITIPGHYHAADIAASRDVLRMRRLEYEVFRLDRPSPLIAEEIVLELLGLGVAESRRPQTMAPRWLREAEERLRDGPDVSLAALAREAERNAAHFARAFRRHFGCSPGEYSRRTRIEHAAEKLRTTDEPLPVIAIESGFYDQSHFTNVFRRLIGTSPSRYRRTFRPRPDHSRH